MSTLTPLLKGTTIKRKSLIAVGAFAAASLIATLVVAPAQASTRDTVVLQENNNFNSFNTGKRTTNLVINSTVNSLMSMGFWYYNDSNEIVPNTDFGTYRVIKQRPFTVRVTVKPGRVWSDGTPITAVDLLLSHMICSQEFSRSAGLGDPSKSGQAAFQASCYTGQYNKLVDGDPRVSGDQMSLTIQFKSPTPDWRIYLPGPSAVHALQLMTDGVKGIQSSIRNKNAKNKFYNAYRTKNTAVLKEVANCWNTCYDVAEVNKDTNPLVYISNGGFIVDSIIKNNSVRMVRNPRYNSGPAFTGNIKNVIIRTIDNPTAALQALRNKEIDVYSGQASADLAKTLSELPGIRAIGGQESAWEHLDLRFDKTFGEDDSYNGPFADKGSAADKAKALDLRRAFLLAIPRDEIVEKIYKPINRNSVVMNSFMVLTNEKAYKDVASKNGSDYYTDGTQAQRTARALALVKKHYPNASATNPQVKVDLLWGGLTNTRRVATAQLIVAEAKKAGFDVNAPGDDSWGPNLVSSKFDAFFFGYRNTSILQSKGCDLYYGENNYGGFDRDKIMKPLCDPLAASPLSDDAVNKAVIEMEKVLHEEAYGLSIAQFPLVVGINENLKGIKLGFYPLITWNFWEWSF